jgi:thioredoxin reductase (NADPH)
VFSELTDPFPRLSEADIALLQSYGNRRPIRPEEYLFRQGDQTNDFFIMLSGAIEIIVRNECTDRRQPNVLSAHSASSVHPSC